MCKTTNAQMKLSVLPEIIAKAESPLPAAGRARLTYGTTDSSIILPLQSEISLILSVWAPLSVLI